jgi:hypothetical protein
MLTGVTSIECVRHNRTRCTMRTWNHTRSRAVTESLCRSLVTAVVAMLANGCGVLSGTALRPLGPSSRTKKSTRRAQSSGCGSAAWDATAVSLVRSRSPMYASAASKSFVPSPAAAVWESGPCGLSEATWEQPARAAIVAMAAPTRRARFIEVLTTCASPVAAGYLRACRAYRTAYRGVTNLNSVFASSRQPVRLDRSIPIAPDGLARLGLAAANK